MKEAVQHTQAESVQTQLMLTPREFEHFENEPHCSTWKFPPMNESKVSWSSSDPVHEARKTNSRHKNAADHVNNDVKRFPTIVPTMTIPNTASPMAQSCSSSIMSIFAVGGEEVAGAAN